ncbi:hypothetical protein JCM10213v2_000283 [Rhodosporidiobolus nylandii]
MQAQEDMVLGMDVLSDGYSAAEGVRLDHDLQLAAKDLHSLGSSGGGGEAGS